MYTFDYDTGANHAAQQTQMNGRTLLFSLGFCISFSGISVTLQ
jgi:hypothetical protein